MNFSAEQECISGESHVSIDPCPSHNIIAIPMIDSTSEQPIDGDAVSRLRHHSSEPLCEVEDAIVSNQATITPLVVNQVPTTLSASLSSNPRAIALSTHDIVSKSRNGDGDNYPHMQMIVYQNEETANAQRYGKLSALGCKDAGPSDKVPGTHITNGLPPICSNATLSSNAAKVVSSFLAADEPSAKDSYQQVVPQQGTKNLALQNITPLDQDIESPPKILEGTKDSSPLEECRDRSPGNQDLKETGQPLQVCGSSPDGDCQEMSPEISTLKGVISSTEPEHVEDSLDDDVTFIVSIPRRRKRKKRSDLATAKLAKNPVDKATLSTAFELTRTPTSITYQSLVPPKSSDSSITGTAALNVEASTTSYGNTIPLTPDPAAPYKPELENSVSGQTSVLLENPSRLSPGQKTASSLGNQAAITTTQNEVTESCTSKRKVGEVDGRDPGTPPPTKRAKFQKEQNFTASAVPLTNGTSEGILHRFSACAAIKSPSATSFPKISNQKHGIGTGTPAFSQPNFDVGNQSSGLPILGQHTPQESLTFRRMPMNNDLQDIRRKPSLYSIPSWPSPPISSNVSGNQQDSTSKNTTSTSQVTQTKSSPLSVSQYAELQKNIPCLAIPTTSQISYPSQVRSSASSSQPNAMMSRSMEDRSRPGGSAQLLAGQHAISAWPSQQLQTVEQRMQQDRLRSQLQRITYTPQEYARYLHSQQVKVTQQKGSQLSPSTESLTQNSSIHALRETDQSKTLPLPNLLVDIAQTCQAMFPFARVAERHNQPIKKVFDAFSAVIQIPLLQSAADSRRNGKLGTARLKKFRELSKAVSDSHERERKAEKEGAKLRDELNPPPAKRPKGRPPKSAGAKGLLGMALANSHKNASGK